MNDSAARNLRIEFVTKAPNLSVRLGLNHNDFKASAEHEGSYRPETIICRPHSEPIHGSPGHDLCQAALPFRLP